MSKPFDPTKPVQTRVGVPARILASDAKQPKFPIIALSGEDSESVASYGPQGEFYGSLARPDPRDLVNVPESPESIYWNYGPTTVSVAFPRTLESLRQSGFEIRVDNLSNDYAHTVTLSKSGCKAAGWSNDLQVAVDRAFDAWNAAQLRDYKTVLYVFDDGTVTTNSCAPHARGAKQIARKEITFQARPGDTQ